MDSESELMYVIYQMIKFLKNERWLPRKDIPEITPKFISLAIQTMSLVSSMDLDLEPQSMFRSSLKRLITASRRISDGEREWELISLVTRMSCLSRSVDTKQQVDEKFESLIIRILSHLENMVLHSELETSYFELMSHVNSWGKEVEEREPEAILEWEIRSLIPREMSLQLVPTSKLIPNIIQCGLTQLHVTRSSSVVLPLEVELVSLVLQMLTFLRSEHYKSNKEVKPEFASLVIQTMSIVRSMDLDSQQLQPESMFRESLKQLINVARSISDSEPEWDLIALVAQMSSLSSFTQEPKPELVSLTTQILSHLDYLDDDSQLKQVFDIFVSLVDSLDPEADGELEVMSLNCQIMNHNELEISTMGTATLIPLVYLVKFLHLDSKSRQGSKVLPLISQLISVAKSVSDSEPDWELTSLVTQMVSLISSLDLKPEYQELHSLIIDISSHLGPMDTDSKLCALLEQILRHAKSFAPDLEPEKFYIISLSPQSQVEYVSGKFYVIGQVRHWGKAKAVCDSDKWERYKLTKDKYGANAFRCKDCNGNNHEEFRKASTEIQHPLHPKHSLQLVQCLNDKLRKCYCCDERLLNVFYYCSACDYAMNIGCAEKRVVAVVDRSRWHNHTLQLFPRPVFLNCNLCALADSSSPIFMCLPCDFVAHLRCINLPRVIKISRHSHRILFTSSFIQGDWSCGVCLKKIDNDYGGYSCLKEGCLYTAHSRCAIQSNIWDGKDLDGEPEEIEDEVLEPFVMIRDGIIEHFLHQHHHLRLTEDIGRDYDDNKQCSACITPIYVGNVYSCMQCEFIMHETCANLSRKVHHPVHAHPLILEEADGYGTCGVCPRPCEAGFRYKCNTSDCLFHLHVQCNTTSGPLLHESHTHPLALTSKPEERRTCGVCKYSRFECTNETFNCIEEECDFALCFKCATIPQKARYKHDKHMLTLSYGEEETSTMSYWCEVCEGKIDPQKRFYMCRENCCVTLHMDCLIGKDLYMKPNSSFEMKNHEVKIMPNNQHMSRPICFFCKKRCLYRIVLECNEHIYCSKICFSRSDARG